MKTALARVPETPLYDEMCRAISTCVRIDEVKDIRDKMAALEVYYRQAHNVQAEREACIIRLRAARRIGVLLGELERGSLNGQHFRGTRLTAYSRALKRIGLASHTAASYQRLARVPEGAFEAALATPEMPSLTRIIGSATRAYRVQNVHVAASDEALLIWDHIRELRRLLNDPTHLVALHMTDEMRASILEAAPLVRAQLATLIGEPK